MNRHTVFFHGYHSTVTVSELRIPETAPEPYWMEKAVPFFLKEDDFEESYFSCRPEIKMKCILKITLVAKWST